VLVGDAAGASDPVIGLGLSITVRDVRLVAETLLGTAEWDAAMFEPYAVERAERMRRLRVTAAVATRLRTTFTEEGRRLRAAAFARITDDPGSWQVMLAALVGPHQMPPDAFEPEAVERMLAL
jgi:2-polyprenyl-6-methoxyphenol hydroxylase-like FAD-dependent oxidoreductase